MKYLKLSYIILGCAFLFTLSVSALEEGSTEKSEIPFPELPDSFEGVVSAVTDGDLLTLKVAEKNVAIRLFGVDAPEKDQPGHEVTLQFLTENLLNKKVKAEYLAVDNAGLPICRIEVLPEKEEDGEAKGFSLEDRLLREGFAWWDNTNVPDNRDFKKQMATAITGKKGLWAEPLPLAPWDYRKSNQLPEVVYHMRPKKEEAPEPAVVAEEEEETKVLSKKGNAVYVDTPVIEAGKIDFKKQDVDIPQLMMRHQPRIATDSGGNPIGVTATDIGAIPFARELGFQDGDVVTSVNGVPLNDLSQAPQLIERFKNEKQFNVEILRNGRVIMLPIRP